MDSDYINLLWKATIHHQNNSFWCAGENLIHPPSSVLTHVVFLSQHWLKSNEAQQSKSEHRTSVTFEGSSRVSHSHHVSLGFFHLNQALAEEEGQSQPEQVQILLHLTSRWSQTSNIKNLREEPQLNRLESGRRMGKKYTESGH